MIRAMLARQLPLCTSVAVTMLSACVPADTVKQIDAQIVGQPIKITHYGDDGALAEIIGKKGLYRVIFDPDCKSCQIAERAIEPASVYDTSLCEFEMTVSANILKPTPQLAGTMKITRVDRQPDAIARQGEALLERRCRQLLDPAT